MNYADITFKDKSAIKRWLQTRRLVVASRIASVTEEPTCMLDFGAGNGELCKLLVAKFPNSKIICYEPVSFLMNEARLNLRNHTQIQFCENIKDLPKNSIDFIFCLEVFEHLPDYKIAHELHAIDYLLKKNGVAVIGVPVEIGFPALYKGIFRLCRRRGTFDTAIVNIARAILFSPPTLRPQSEISPGFPFFYEHMGFDFRKLEKIILEKFNVIDSLSSPFSIFGSWLHPEINFVIKKRNDH
jgi:SAM-dependent methyltransferase